MHRSYSLFPALGALFVFGCNADGTGSIADVGTPPVDTGVRDTGTPPRDTGVPPDTGVQDAGDLPDGGTPDMGAPDGGPPPVNDVTISGKVRRLGAYLAGTNAYVGSAAVLAYGVLPETSTISDETNLGYYSVKVPANGDVIFFASKAGYHQTFYKVTVADQDVQNQSLPLAEAAWLSEITAAHNVDLDTPFACQTPGLTGETCIYSIIVGRILDDGTAGAGQIRPVAGVSAGDFTLSGPNNDATWYRRGPYFLSSTGTSSATATQSIVDQDGQGNYLGGLFIVFIEVPQQGGQYPYIDMKLQIRHDDNGTVRGFGPIDVQAFRGPGGAVSWASISETGVIVPPPPGNVDFDTQVYPMFLPVPQGGLGCQGCHTTQGGVTPAAGMDLHGATTAYASLDPQTYPLRVNLAMPDQSLLLTKPLYEAVGPQNHPIFAFASPNDAGYQIILQWITEGAQRNVVVAPVSFANDVHRGLYNDTQNGGWGCRACHYDTVTATTAPGGFYISGDPAAVYDELVNEAPEDNGLTGQPYRIDKDPQYTDRSLVLTNPLLGNPEPHPVKIFYDNTDPRYVLIYRWIQEGYNNN